MHFFTWAPVCASTLRFICEPRIRSSDLYRIETEALNQAVRRHIDFERCPEDFMVQLVQKEGEIVTSRIVSSNAWGGRRTLLFAFTKQGAATPLVALHLPRAIYAIAAHTRLHPV